jgi:Rieske Fe-S protein
MPNRRLLLKRATKWLATTMVLLPLARAAKTPVYIVKPSELAKPFAFKAFSYNSDEAILLRLPDNWREQELKTLQADEKIRDTGILQVMVNAKPWFFIAYWRACPHAGCAINLPDAQNQFYCPCHATLFTAQSGAVRSGPSQLPLQRLRLAYDDLGIYATGTFEPGE